MNALALGREANGVSSHDVQVATRCDGGGRAMMACAERCPVGCEATARTRREFEFQANGGRTQADGAGSHSAQVGSHSHSACRLSEQRRHLAQKN